MRALAAGALCVGWLAVGCRNEHPIKTHEVDWFREDTTRMCRQGRSQLDILFVVDDSASMATEAGTLAQNVGPIMAEVERLDLDYRIAVTTTSVSHPGCAPANVDDGAFVTTSCRERLDDFVVGDSVEGEAADVSETGCTSVCDLDTLNITPSTIDVADLERPRPWLEQPWGTNLPGGVTMTEALGCLLPQGVAGCEHESPLEAMYRALRRAFDSSDPAYGFIRRDALLLVVFVTDEPDGSLSPEHAAAFDPEGSRSLWSDPTLPTATSAVAWNAGVACTGGPGTYDDCYAVDRDANGLRTTGDEAVLHPLGRYIDLLDTIRRQKAMRVGGDWGVSLAVIGGVPQGYDSGQSIVYQDAADAAWQVAHGIGPGCQSAAGVAAPPVRLREVTEEFAFQGPRLYSICASDYSHILEPFAGWCGLGGVRPACFTGCAADEDPTTESIEPQCQVTRETADANTDIPPCTVDLEAGAWDFPDDHSEFCYRALTSNSTATAIDDMSGGCLDEGWNLEFVIEVREGVDASDACVSFTCSVSDNTAVDCPYQR